MRVLLMKGDHKNDCHRFCSSAHWFQQGKKIKHLFSTKPRHVKYMLLMAGLVIARATIPPIHWSSGRHLDWSPVQHVHSHSHTRVFSYCGRENKTSQNGQSEDAHNQQRPKPGQKTGNISGNNQNHTVRQSCGSSFTNSHLLLLLYPADWQTLSCAYIYGGLVKKMGL